MKFKETIIYLQKCGCIKLLEIFKKAIEKNATEMLNNTGQLLLSKYPTQSAELLIENYHNLPRGLQVLMLEKKEFFTVPILKAVNSKNKSFFNAQKYLLQLNDIDSLELIKEVLFVCDKSLANDLCDVIEQIMLNFKQIWICSVKSIQALIYTDEEGQILAKLQLLELEKMAEKIVEIVDTLLFVAPQRIPDEMIVIMLFLGPHRYSGIPLNELFSDDDPEIKFLSDYSSWRVLTEALVDTNVKVSLKVKEAILKNENFETPVFLMYCLENKRSNLRKIAVNIFRKLKSIHSLKGLLNLRNTQNFKTRKKLIEKAGTVPYISLCIKNVTYLSNQIGFELLKDADVILDLESRFQNYIELLNFDDQGLINRVLRRFKYVKIEKYFAYLFDALLVPILTTQKTVCNFLFKQKLSKNQKFQIVNRIISSPFADIRKIAKENINDDIMQEILKNDKSEVFRYLKLKPKEAKNESNKFIALIRNKLESPNPADVLKGLNLIDINSKATEKLHDNLHGFLQNDNLTIKKAAIRIFWKLNTITALESIVNLLNSEDRIQKLAALEVIEEINDHRLAVYLDEVLKSDDSHLKARAISILYGLTHDDEKLLPELRKMLTSSKDEDVEIALKIVNIFDINKVLPMLDEYIITSNTLKMKAGILKAISKLRARNVATEELRAY